MITISRNLARQVRAVFRRALCITQRGLSYPVTIETSPDGLRIWAKSQDAAVQYHDLGDYPAEQVTLPFQFLSDCEGRKDEPVQLEAQGAKRVSAQWRDGKVPQIVEYDRVPPGKEALLPPVPETLAQNEGRLLRALEDASENADANPIRFATNHLRLRGADGSVAATDGRQLLVQAGFSFPWQDDVLVPRSTVFGCRNLPQDVSAAVGRTDDWAVFVIGPWTIWLAVNKTGRFPELDRHVLQPKDAVARCQLVASDAQFLAQSLPRLPCDDANDEPITIELNGSIAVRAKGEGSVKPTELVLSGSTWSGQPIRVNSNRRFLARALRLGFGEICLYDPRTPILCRDRDRSFVWAPLDPDSAIAPTDDAIRILSTGTDATNATSNNHHERKSKTMSRSRNGTSGTTAVPQPTETAPAASNGDSASLLDQARAVHETLRAALAKTGQLMLAIKHQEKRRRALQSTLASLRQLQTIEA